jgi:nickel transport protein
MRIAFLTLIICLLMPAAPAQSHRANVFAWVEDSSVIGEASFAGGRPAVNSRISVMHVPSGREVLSTETDDSGKFSFDIPESVRRDGGDLEVVLEAGMGHRDSWVVKAVEYGAAGAEQDEPRQDRAAPSGTPEPAGSCADAEKIEELAASVKALSGQVGEISETLARRSESGPGLGEIVAGIGYIFGLMGIAAYIRSRGK